MVIASFPETSEQRFLLPNVSWELYDRLLAEVGARHIRLTYERGVLELMAPSYRHERFARLIANLLEVFAEETQRPLIGAGSTTFRRIDLERSLESDECFYIQNAPAILGKADLDLSVDPPPDLAIEVDITRSSLDRMGVYAALGVPEVWRFNGETIEVHWLQTDGTYRPQAGSPSFPEFPISDLADFVRRGDFVDDVSLKREFREHIRRNRPNDGLDH